MTRNFSGDVTCLDVVIAHLLMNRVLIMGVTETHLTGETDVSDSVHSLYRLISTPRPGGSSWGGTGVLIHRSLCFRNLTSDFSDVGIEATVVDFVYRGTSVVFVVVYLPQQTSEEISGFFKLMDKVMKRKCDILIVCGDFNCWNISWGDRDNSRGIALMKGLRERGLGVKRCAGPTRIGRGGQRDSYVDLVISNDCGNLSDLVNSFQISDHVIVSCTYNVKGDISKRRRKWDFRRSYEKFGKEIGRFFDDVDWRSVFNGCHIEDIPSAFNTKVMEGWRKFGVYKWVNSESRPEFTPVCKTLRRQARFWERQYKRAGGRGDQILVQGDLVTLSECRRRHLHYLSAWRDKVREIRHESSRFVNNLLEKNVFKTVRRLYRQRTRTIPTLVVQDGESRVRVSEPEEKATLFLRKFMSNSCVATGCEEDIDYIRSCANICNSDLTRFRCDGECIQRLDEVTSVITTTILDDIDRAAGMAEPQDPCNRYFSKEEVAFVRTNLKKGKGSIGLKNDHLRKVPSDKLDEGLQLMANISGHLSYLTRVFRIYH